MCKRDEETVNHLSIACLLDNFGPWYFLVLGITGLCQKVLMELLGSWKGNLNRYANAAIWSMIPHCLMWGIWWEQNSRTFEGCERSVHE